MTKDEESSLQDPDSPRATIKTGAEDLVIRRATESDLRAIVGLLADDPLGATRESTGDTALEPYRRAFREIDVDPSELLIVATIGNEVVATLQLSFLPGLSRSGARRAQIEAVRVRDISRGSGLGTSIIEWAIGEAQRRGCALVQLTTDKSRPRALAVYKALGFTASHEGLKLRLPRARSPASR